MDHGANRYLTQQRPQSLSSMDAESLLFANSVTNKKMEGGLRMQGWYKHSQPNEPLVSVVTVVFNSENDLEATIQSVINQDYKNVEYVIIDGGSTDGTIDVINKYNDEIDYWVSEEDDGLYDAMNRGLACITGDWVGFWNSGDLFDPGLLGSLNMTGEMSLILMNVVDGDLRKDDPGFLRNIFSPCVDGKSIRKISDPRTTSPYCHQGILFKRDDKIIYDTNYQISADYKYMLEYIVKYNIDIEQLPIQSGDSFVHYKSDGVSRQNRVQRDIEFLIIAKQFFGLGWHTLSIIMRIVFNLIRTVWR